MSTYLTVNLKYEESSKPIDSQKRVPCDQDLQNAITHNH